MTTLPDVIGINYDELYEKYLCTGLVRQQHHNDAPLAILNYTEKATFDKAWDRVTLNCRGLIYDTNTLEVVARPFPKFFNQNEPNAPQFDLQDIVSVSDKMDGSLGILYPIPGRPEWAVATRGSFHSVQAEHATELLRTKYSDWYTALAASGLMDPRPFATLLFEIIYPENRIVLDYGDKDDLVLLGMVDIESGEIYAPQPAGRYFDWRGPSTSVLGVMTYGEALALPPRENAEGVVLRDVLDDRMVKIKQEDYVRLHRIITGLNARSVWEAGMKDGKLQPVDELKHDLPEEFWSWVDEVRDHIIGQYHSMWDEIENEYFKRVVVGGDRVQCARAFQGYEHRWALFMYLDEDYKRIREGIWKRIKPEADWNPASGRREEAATDSPE